MLTDPRITKMAEVLVNYSLAVQPGWLVTIIGSTAAEPLINAAFRSVLQAGANPYVLAELPGQRQILLRYAMDEQLLRTDPYELFALQHSHAILRILSQTNTRESGLTSPDRQALLKKGEGALSELRMQRIMDGRAQCLTLFPTAAYAQDAEMSLSDFEDFVFRACLIDSEQDAADRWREVSKEQQRLVDWLAGRRNLRVEAPRTNLSMSIEGRSFVNSDGKRNFPSGEIFTSPVETSVEGEIYFSYPATYQGRSVDGVFLAFRNGRVVSHHADTGFDFLTAMLDLDEGARKLGEFAIGTNTGVDRITRNTLFDEKMAGTIHCALGAAYPNAGGTNKSALHWDLVTDMTQGRVVVDDVTFYENGHFQV